MKITNLEYLLFYTQTQVAPWIHIKQKDQVVQFPDFFWYGFYYQITFGSKIMGIFTLQLQSLRSSNISVFLTKYITTHAIY